MANGEANEQVLLALAELAKQRFIFVGGKGGVGKSSTSCALALALARYHGKRVLLISTDPAHSVSDCLQEELSNDAKPVPGAENVWALESDPSGSVEELFGSAGDATQGARNGDLMGQMKEMLADMRDWLGNLPGVDEAIALMKILDADDGGLESKYDCVVLDTAPTGHTLKLLKLPGVLEVGIKRLEGWQVKMAQYVNMATMFFTRPGSAAEQGPTPAEQMAEKLRTLKSSVERLRVMLTDSSKTTFVCVCIAEALSVLETRRLLESLQSTKVDSRFLVVNKLLTGTFLPPPGELEASEAAPPAKARKLDDASGHRVASEEDLKAQALYLCRTRATLQAKYLAELRAAHQATHSIIEVQELPYEPRGVARLAEFIETWTA